jgi:NitT/TauT family transport system ATP-binding protein
MADRIVVLSANPGRVRKVVENTLPRPRDYRSPAFLKLVDYLHEIITGTELPDAPEPAVVQVAPGEPTPTPAAPAAPAAAPQPAADVCEPLPAVSPNEVIGLLEYLDARGGREDLFKIATDTNREFGLVIAVVKAAELLDFVDTPKRLVVVEPDGQRFIKAPLEEQKTLWREKILKLRLIQEIRDMINEQPNKQIDRELVLETIVFRIPSEDYEKTFKTMVAWARFGDLFAYDDNTEKLSAQ